MPMVGRDRELARVMLLLDDAVAGGGRLVLCTGEAGIGETRVGGGGAAVGGAGGWGGRPLGAASRGAWRGGGPGRGPGDGRPPCALWRLVREGPAAGAADDDP